jgi:hypothetical protein
LSTILENVRRGWIEWGLPVDEADGHHHSHSTLSSIRVFDVRVREEVNTMSQPVPDDPDHDLPDAGQAGEATPQDPEDLVASWHLDSRARMDEAIRARDQLIATNTPDTSAGQVTVDTEHGVRVGDVNLTDLTTTLQSTVLAARHTLTPASTLDEAGLLRILDVIRHLTGILAALEMLIVCLLDVRIRARDTERDVPAKQQGRATAGLVGIATRTSPSIARMSLRAAQRVTGSMPGMFTALATGRLPPRQATSVGTRTGGMTPTGRNLLDAALVDHLPDTTGAGAGQWATIITKTASVLEPDGATSRHQIAHAHRHVTITPAADGMAHINLYVDGLDAAAFARHNHQTAQALKNEGEVRPVSQIQADLALNALLGRTEDHEPVTVTVDVVMDVATLLTPDDGTDSPDVTIPGAGTYPARPLIDQILNTVSPHGDLREHLCPIPERRPDGTVTVGPPAHRFPLPPGLPDVVRAGAVQLRRLFTHPTSGQLVAAESRARAFPAALARLIRLRDGLCRGLYCDAPIRHIDHVIDHADGGPTSQTNGQGLCAFHNYLKTDLATITLHDDPAGQHVDWNTLLGTITTRPDPLTGPDLPTTREYLNPPQADPPEDEEPPR